jgi:hypothetical protein
MNVPKAKCLSYPTPRKLRPGLTNFSIDMPLPDRSSPRSSEKESHYCSV